MKRLLDILVSGVAILLLLPFGLVIMLILRFTGEGEVFYVQQRVGRDGKLFGLYKFVTMVKNSENIGTGSITLQNDPRVLPIGKFLRKTKLNEVSQILNVFKGDMSLVGPRPLTPQTFGYYSEDIQREVVKVPPGLTGAGSIYFRDEESIIGNSQKKTEDCYRDEIAPPKGRLERWYIANHSFWLDLKLIFLTAVVVVFPNNQFFHKVLRLPLDRIAMGGQPDTV